MKFTRLLTAALLAFGAATADAQSAANTVRFRLAGPDGIAPGEAFTVALQVEPGSEPVAGLAFVIGYDPAALAVVSTESGPFLGAAGVAFSPQVDAREGRIRVTTRRGDGGAGATAGVIAKMTFRPLRRFAATTVTGMTMAPITPDGQGIPADYPPPLTLKQRPR